LLLFVLTDDSLANVLSLGCYLMGRTATAMVVLAKYEPGFESGPQVSGELDA
jgi:hypothetical protein